MSNFLLVNDLGHLRLLILAFTLRMPLTGRSTKIGRINVRNANSDRTNEVVLFHKNNSTFNMPEGILFNAVILLPQLMLSRRVINRQLKSKRRLLYWIVSKEFGVPGLVVCSYL